MISNSKVFDILEIRDYYPSKNNPSSSTWVYNQVLSLSEMGYNPVVISPTPINPLKKILKNKFRLYDSPTIKMEDYMGTTVIRPPYIKIPRNKLIRFTLLNLSKCIMKYGDIQNIKLIHAHFGQNGVAALRLKEKLNVPLITSFYGYDSGRLAEKYRPFYKELRKKGDLFLVLSQDMKNDLLKLGFPEEKIVIHHLGINLNNFTTNNLKPKDNKYTFCTVCRLDKSKGVHFVIEAFNRFLSTTKKKYDYQLRIIGGGPYEDELKILVSQLELQNKVVFINNLILPNAREIVLDEMRNCIIFILASYSSHNATKEGTPVVLMEAQACGKPCIATNHAGIPEVVLNRETGFIIPESSVYEIEECMHIFVDNKEIYAEYSIAAHNHIQKEFNHILQMKKLDNLIKAEIHNIRKAFKP